MKTLQIALGVFLGSLFSSLIILYSVGTTIDHVIEAEAKKYPKHFTIDGVECIADNIFAISCNWNKEGEK